MDGDARLNKARRAYFNITWWSSTPDSWNLECLFALFVLFRLSDCCSQILILDAQIFDIYHSVAMRVRDAYDHDQDWKKMSEPSRCWGRSKGPEQKARLATHLPAGMTGGAIWLTWSHVIKQWWCGYVGILPWGASHGSDREWHVWHVQWMEMRGVTLCDFIRTGHLFLIHSGPLLPSDSEPCWKNCQAGKPCKGHNPGLVWAWQSAST